MKLWKYLAILTISPLAVTGESVNKDAIPGYLTPENTKVKLKPSEALNLKKADFILKDVKIGGEPVPSVYDREIAKRRKAQFDADPKQNRPLKDCIKPNSKIDQEVQDCVAGLIYPYWKE